MPMRILICLFSTILLLQMNSGCTDSSNSSSDADADTDTDTDTSSDTDTGTDTGPCVDSVVGAPTVASSDMSYTWDTTSDTYILIFNEDVTNVESSSITWTAITGTGTMGNIISVDASHYEIEFSGVSEGDEYTITIGTGVTDLCGNALTEPVEITITVELCIDLVDGGPSVTSEDEIYPPSTTSDSYQLTFSEGVVGVSSSNIAWTAVTGTGTLDGITPIDEATYDLSFSGVVDNDEYTITVGTGITDICGTPLSDPVDVSLIIGCNINMVYMDELNIGDTDYVVLHNPTSCDLDLNPLYVYFNDSNGTVLNVDIPTFVLTAGSSVYVAESPLAGDIDSISNIPFSSTRGGWTALCNGSCDLVAGSNWIDLVAFSEGQAHPPLPTGVTFSPSGLSNIIDESVNSYYHTVFAGDNPAYLASDWSVSVSTR